MHVVKASPADRRPWRFGYLVLLMAFAISYFTWRSYPDVKRATQAATTIRTIVKKDPRFIDVTVWAGPKATIFIVARDKLSPELKTALQRVANENSFGQRISLQYVVQIENSGQ